MVITLNIILEELNDVPVEKLNELHNFINSLKSSPENSEKKRKKYFLLPVHLSICLLMIITIL